MNWRLLPVFFLAIGTSLRAGEPPDDKNSIQGVWRIDSVASKKGRSLNFTNDELHLMELTIKNEQASFRIRLDEVKGPVGPVLEGLVNPLELTFTLDAKKAQKEIDFTWKLPTGESKVIKTYTLPGLYKLDGHTLTVSINDGDGWMNRPKDFSPTENNEYSVFVLKRQNRK